jgi:parvulin-like peptidyl-prolyl isomerase
MMQSMRDNMKLVIWITAIVFMVGFGILQLGGVLNPPTHQGPTGVVAVINGDKISYQEFMNVYQGMVHDVQQQRPLKEGEDSYIREQAWQRIVRDHLLRQQVKKYGIKVSPEEIKTAIRYAPPTFITQAPAFQTNGKFDYKKYVAELDNPNSQVPWDQVEALVADQLPIQKLETYIASPAKVSEGDVRDRFQLLHDSMNLRVLWFQPDSFRVDTTQATDAMVRAYYKAHPDEFAGPAEVQVEAALEPREPIDEDFTAVRDRLEQIRAEVVAQPDSFASFARSYSEIMSSERGGETLSDPRLQDLKEGFRDAFAKAKPGDITPVLRQPRSMHLFQILKRYKDPKTGDERFHYREIALRVDPGAEAIRRERAVVDAFLKDAHREGVVRAATQHGVRVQTSPWFLQGQSNNDVFQRFPEIETWCFTAKVGSISQPIPHENGWYVYQILGRRPAGLKPFDQIRDLVRRATIRSLRMEKAKAVAEQARAAILAGMAPEEAAKKYGARYFPSANGVTRNGIISGIGRDPESVGALMTLPAGQWGPVQEGPPGVMVAQVVAHNHPTEEAFQKQAAELRQSLVSERERVLVNEWYNGVRRAAKIQDYREDVFGV